MVPFRYRPRNGDINAFNRRLLEQVNARQRVFLTSTLVRGEYVLRIAALSFRTHASIMIAALEDLVEVAQELDQA